MMCVFRGSWNDWQDFLELRPRTRPRTLAAFGGQRDAPHGEDVRAFAELFRLYAAT